MKKIIIATVLLILNLTIYGQIDKVYNGSREKSLDSAWSARILPVDVAPTYFITAKLGKLKRVQSSDGDDFYPIITINTGDTTNITPGKAGDIFINTTAGKVYISKSGVRGGWLLLNLIIPILIIRKRKR